MPESEPTSPVPQEDEADAPSESTPLLSHNGDSQNDASSEPAKESAGDSKSRWRWPSIIAIIVLALLTLAVIGLGFVTPPAVREYVEKAAVLEPTSLSIENLTADGVRARIQANFHLDSSRVSDHGARRIGRFVTGAVRRLEADVSPVALRLPGFDGALLGTAIVPGLSIDLVEGHNNRLDFVTDVNPGDSDVVRRIVNQWLAGELKQLKITGATELRLNSGILPLGTHQVAESVVLQAKDAPSMPEYNISRLVVYDEPVGHHGKMVLAANASVSLYNEYLIGFDIPPVGLDVLVPNCNASESNIQVATVLADTIHVRPESDVVVDAHATVSKIPESLTRACPDTKLSPLDNLMGRFLQGENAHVLVRGKVPAGSDLPDWAGSILESVVVPLPLGGHSFGNLLRNFSFSDVHFKLPSPFADPDDDSGKPRVSGTVQVLAALPAKLDVDLAVDSLRADGDLFYHGDKFGRLRLDKWQKANSTMGSEDGQQTIAIVSRVADAPIDILDGQVFGEIMQKLLFGDDDMVLDVKAAVDISVATVLGKLVLRSIPAEGKIPVKRPPGDIFGAMKPQIEDVKITNTSETGVSLRASANLTNATPYTADIPFLSVHIMKEGHQVGEAIVKDVALRVGHNSGLSGYATWDPRTFGGESAREAGRRLLSDYLSGRKTSVELQAHRGSIPTAPALGEALSRLNLTLSTPRLKLPGDEEDEHKTGFLRAATFHVIRSTASFTLASPLQHDSVRILHIDATALYNHSEPLGRIVHDEPFDVAPGMSESPKLPVQWSGGRVGFEKLKKMLGGSLKLDAVANVTVALGEWTEEVEYRGRGIGAKVALFMEDDDD
ncbi:pre-rRNA processing protein [Ophiocordyceps camponoti-floridani]|uniref:Pre-rRNA processing protein n=1 Tax=Ophiocordyceps camponoti-floridani TaxID=2030778 RepID=A0A8H4VB54_9HYPO|nr:pre-rRNA processing protein [Ophiocordyceps camponoti-floridani]